MDMKENCEIIYIDHIYSTICDDVKPTKKAWDNKVDFEANEDLSKSSNDFQKQEYDWKKIFSAVALLFFVVTLIFNLFTAVYLLHSDKRNSENFKYIQRNFEKMDSVTKDMSDKIGTIVHNVHEAYVNDSQRKMDSVTKNITDHIGTIKHNLHTLEEKVDIITDKVLRRNVTGWCSNLNDCETTEHADFYHCFKFLKEYATWHEAVDKCKTIGGFLAEVHDYTTLYYLEKIASENNLHFWLGATDEVQEGHWKWITSGKAMSVTGWAAGEPNNGGGVGTGEDYLHLSKDANGKWNDAILLGRMYFVCQKNSDTCEGWL